MSVDPQSGPSYQYPADSAPTRPEPVDPGFYAPASATPDEDISPLHVTPAGQEWIRRNVIDQDYVIDWGTREVIDPETGEVKGTVPSQVPKVI
jgi:hypothetical protein